MLVIQEMSPKQRKELIDTVYDLPEELVDRLVVNLNQPRETRLGDSASLGNKISKLLEYCESPFGCGLVALAEEVERLKKLYPEKVIEETQQKINNLEQELKIRQWLDENLPPNYTLGETLGQSDWTLVFQAYDTQLKRSVAVKVLSDLDYKDIFIKNTQKAAVISEEDHFITIFEAFFDNNCPYYVMQFIDGKNLRQLIEERGEGFPVTTVIKIILAIGDALTQVKHKKFVHDNIKPSNILIANEDEQYDLPFISPLCQSENGISAYLRKRLSKEDLSYLIPDKILNHYHGHDIVPEKAEQYILGILMYELLTGKFPPTYSNIKKLKQGDLSAFKPLPLISEKLTDLPEILVKVIQRMTSIYPNERYENLKEPLEVIQRFLDPDLNLAKESYKRCIKTNEIEEIFFRTFYDLFRSQDSEIDRRFHRLDEQDNWPRQHQLLKEAILLLFVFYEQKESDDPNILSRITTAHRNVPVNFYNHFVNTLITTVCGNSQQSIKPFDPKCKNKYFKEIIETAWRNTLKPGVDYMKSQSQCLS